jgi:ABC-type antimicrobial peptide transport system permease subunit
MQVGAALLVGLVSGAIPAVRAARMRILDGLRSIA